MRWPFSFGRSPAPAHAESAPVRPRRDWATLPVIQRAIGGPTLTAPTHQFVDSLAGTHDPDLSLEPLGHHVSIDAPAGLVGGLARPVETYAASTEMVGRRRPRHDVAVQRRFAPGEPETEPSAGSEGESEVESVALAPAGPIVILDEVVPAHAPLTRLAESDAAAVIRLALHRPSVEPAQVPERKTVASVPAAEPSPSHPVVAQRLTLAQSRRLGLGAPLTHRPVAAVQRSTDLTPSLDLAPVQRQEAAEPPASDATPSSQRAAEQPAPVLDPAPIPRVAPLVGQRVRADDSGDSGELGPESLPESPDDEASLPPARAAGMARGSAAGADAPAIQRAIARPLPPTLPRASTAPTAPLTTAGPSLFATRRVTGERVASAGAVDLTPVQRLASHVSGGDRHADLGHSPLRPAPVNLYADAFPAKPKWSSSAPLPAAARPGAPASVQRSVSAHQDFVAISPFVQPELGRAVAPAPTLIPVTAQREVTPGESPASGPIAGESPSAAPAAPAAGGAPAHSDQDLDQLARQLHDRMTLLLRRELLVERERAGMVTDLR